MKLSFSQIFEGAGMLWRGNRDLLMRVAAVFFFLPGLAAELFLLPPDVAKLDPVVAWEQIAVFWNDNWYWFLILSLIQLYGIATLLVLLLDSERPKLGQALIAALGLLPLLILASIMQSAITTLALFLLIVPALYLTGRLLVTGPALVALPSHNPFAAIATSIRLTHGNGWKLFLLAFAVWISALFVGGLFGGGGVRADVATTVLGAVFALGGAAVSAAGALALVLLQVSAYRALTEPRQGM